MKNTENLIREIDELEELRKATKGVQERKPLNTKLRILKNQLLNIQTKNAKESLQKSADVIYSVFQKAYQDFTSEYDGEFVIIDGNTHFMFNGENRKYKTVRRVVKTNYKNLYCSMWNGDSGSGYVYNDSYACRTAIVDLALEAGYSPEDFLKKPLKITKVSDKKISALDELKEDIRITKKQIKEGYYPENRIESAKKWIKDAQKSVKVFSKNLNE